MVAKAMHENSDNAASWEELKDKTRSKKISRAKQWLNTIAVDAMTPDLLNESDPNGDVKGWFKIMSDLMME